MMGDGRELADAGAKRGTAASSRPLSLAFAAALLAILGPASGPALASTDQPPPPPPPTILPPLTPAVVDNTLAIGGEDIAARKVSTRMTVAVRIDGRGPFRFVVDSGADTSVVGVRTARALALPAGTPATLHSMTASGPVDRVSVAELGVGQSTLHDLQLAVLKEEDVGADGLIGIDALVEQRLMMDFDKRVITIEDAHRPIPRWGNDIVVIARRRRGQLILTQASVDGRQTDAVIDTGSEVTIGNTALRDRLARRLGRKLQTVEVIGVTGVAMPIQIARVAELRVGPIVFRDVPIAFADVPPFAAFGLTDQPTMMLGTDLMEKFRRISLDFRRRKVRFQLKRCTGTSIRISTSTSFSRIYSSDSAPQVCSG